MPLVPSFTITPLGDGASFVVADTSSGSDVSITDRQILIYKPDSSLLVPPIDFPLSDGASITLSILTEDIAVTILVNWNNNVGGVLYTFNLVWAFVQFAYLFLQQLTQTQISNPAIVNDLFFMQNKFDLFTEIQSALNAINTGKSVSAAQGCILRYQQLITDSNDYF